MRLVCDKIVRSPQAPQATTAHTLEYPRKASVDQRLQSSFSRSLWYEPDLPGPVFGVAGVLRGHEDFHSVRITLEMGFDLVGACEIVGFDLTGIRDAELLHAAQFAMAARNRVLAGGGCRYVVPTNAWGERLIGFVHGFSRRVATSPFALTLDF